MSQNDMQNQISVIAHSTNQLLANLYKEIRAPNTIFSPYSLQSVLGVAYFGSSGRTFHELKSFLNLPNNKENVKNEWSKVKDTFKLSEFNHEEANGLFPSLHFNIKKSFVNEIKYIFDSEVKSINFSKADQAVEEINDWVENKTHSTIKDLITKNDIDDNTVFVVVNAIYFKGEWKSPFQTSHKKNFYSSPDKVEKVKFMELKGTDISHRNFSNIDAHIIELPYKGNKVAMFLIVPNDRFGIEDVEEKLFCSFDLQTLKQLNDSEELDLSMPKFKFESIFSLHDPLKRCGVQSMFNDGAESGDLSDSKNIYVSKILQKAIIDVNETGTEASAATAMMANSYCLRETKQISIDHPFIFLIMDKSMDVILFYGRVSKP